MRFSSSSAAEVVVSVRKYRGYAGHRYRTEQLSASTGRFLSSRLLGPIDNIDVEPVQGATRRDCEHLPANIGGLCISSALGGEPLPSDPRRTNVT